MNAPLDQSTRQQLLARAARCYRNAGQEQDACRCLESAGDYSAAGLMHEQAARWSEAATCFEQAGQWPLAARCFLAAEQPQEAARCYLAADNPLEAAWVLAHHAHRFDAARAALANFKPQEPEQVLAHMLAMARCAVPAKNGEAGRLLRQVYLRLNELREGAGRNRIMNWAFALADEAMDRPDLVMELMATAWNADIDTRNQWESWAKRRLGSTEVITLLEQANETNTSDTTPMAGKTNNNQENTPS